MSIVKRSLTRAPAIALGWRDNIAKFSAAKGKGTAEPIWTNMGNGHFNYLFLAGDELFVSYHVDHDYALGTNAYPHVHFITDAQMNAGETTVWDFGYVIAKGHAQGQSLLATETVLTLTYTATGNEVVGEHIVLECSDGQAFDLIEPDAVVSGRVRLVSTQSAGNVFGIVADLHYQANVANTPNKAPNFYGG